MLFHKYPFNVDELEVLSESENDSQSSDEK